MSLLVSKNLHFAGIMYDVTVVKNDIVLIFIRVRLFGMKCASY